MPKYKRETYLKKVVGLFFSGVPGVLPEKLEEGMNVQHCALSLVGEPIMYPEINKFVRMLHEKGA